MDTSAFGASMRSMRAPCGDTPLLWKEKGLLVSLVDPPQGPAPGLERLGKKDHAQPPVTSAPIASPSSCIPTAASGEAVLQKPRRQSLEKDWRGGRGSSKPLTLHLSSAWLLEPTSLTMLLFHFSQGN